MVAPLELLENRMDRQPSLMGTLYNPMCAAIAGVGCGAFMNFAFRKPPFSGLQKHVILGSLGFVLGVYFNKKYDERSAARDAVLRHYVELHPDDFPTPEIKKYADVLEPWAPIR